MKCEGVERITFVQKKKTCDHCSGSLGHIKCRDFHDWLANYWLLKGSSFIDIIVGISPTKLSCSVLYQVNM